MTAIPFGSSSSSRRILRAIPVTVGEKDEAAIPFLEQILGVTGEAGAQGTDAVVAVALHPENVRGNGIELVDDVLRVVFIPGIVGTSPPGAASKTSSAPTPAPSPSRRRAVTMDI